jgi:RimJ/RimL family protein N-acetyltransferase
MNHRSRELTTTRLQLRRWRESDLTMFADLNADPRVMQHFPGLLTRAESDTRARQIGEHFEQRGFGLWALEVVGSAPFIGFTGLSVPSFETQFTPCVEIGWRLAFPFWGKGYATEAASAVLQFAFRELGLTEVVSFTVPANARSRAVMERIGMRHCPGEDFDHPNLPEGHPLRHHVLYRLRRDEWLDRGFVPIARPTSIG